MTVFIFTIVGVFAIWVVYSFVKLIGVLGTLILFTLPIFFTYLIIKYSNIQRAKNSVNETEDIGE